MLGVVGQKSSRETEEKGADQWLITNCVCVSQIISGLGFFNNIFKIMQQTSDTGKTELVQSDLHWIV